MNIIKSIEKKLRYIFDPEYLEIINESHLHSGHQPGLDGTGESHIRIRIITQKFNNMKRIERHRKINALLNEEMKCGLHAVAIEAHSPLEKLHFRR